VELELRFEDLEDDVLDAVVDVQVNDLAMADAPAGPTQTVPGRISVRAAPPSVLVSVDAPDPRDLHEPGLLVRVRARAAGDGPVQFLNTTATPLPRDPSEPVPVRLVRIT
jgi:hypothetical protein